MWQQALIMLLALSSSKLSRIAAQVDKNVICRDIRIGDVVPNPLDCASYFVCGTQKPILQFCDGGLHFDAEHKVCNWPELAKCKFGVVSIGASAVTVYPVFNHTDATTSTTTTELNEPITSSSTSAEDSTTYTTPHFSSWDNLRLTFGAFSITDGQPIDPMEDYDAKRIQCHHRGAYFLPHPRSCQKYYFCAFGHLLMHECGRGAAWNYKLMQCEIANEAECFASSDGSTATTAATPNKTVTVCYPIETTLINGTTITTWQPFWKPIATTWSPNGNGVTLWTTSKPNEPIVTGYTPTPATNTVDPTSTTEKTTSGRFDTDSDLNCGEGIKYLGDVTDCTHYFICIQGIPVGMFCPKDSYWHYKEDICATKERVQCLTAAS